MARVGVLHPGAMGSGIGGALRDAGHDVRWCMAGRSDATAARADAAGLVRCSTLASLVGSVDVIISVCPPAAAPDVALAVGATGFGGLYLDANAISPDRARSLVAMVAPAT